MLFIPQFLGVLGVAILTSDILFECDIIGLHLPTEMIIAV